MLNFFGLNILGFLFWGVVKLLEINLILLRLVFDFLFVFDGKEIYCRYGLFLNFVKVGPNQPFVKV